MKRRMWWLGAGLAGVLAAGVAGGQIVLAPTDGGERSAVVFDHDGHVTALDDDCTRCHERRADGMLALTRTTPTDPTAAREAAHRQCGDCHLEQGRGPHPALCAACHTARREPPAGTAAPGMAAFDHDVHLEALDDICARCHHVGDPTTGQPVPADGDEAACADCHDGPALRRAAHASCVGCHETADAGPLACDDCHTH